MANEATKVYAQNAAGDEIQDYTVADGTGIEKGTVLKLSDPRTAAASDGERDVLAGIAAREKIASDGRTQLAVHRKGDFEMKASGAITLGYPVISAGHDNYVKLDTGIASGAAILGYALETFSDDEVGEIRVNL